MSSPPDLSRLRIERKEDKPRRAWSWPAAALVGLGVVSLLWAWLQSGESGERPVREEAHPVAASSPLSPTALSATGYVVAQRKAAVSSKATGRLKELAVSEGDEVKLGQVIGVLENDDLSAAVRALEANLRAAKSRVIYTLAELENARQERDRVTGLARQGVVSRSDAEQAEARVKKSAAEVDMSRAQVAVTEAELERARVDLDYTFIRAPFDGTVLTKNADVGEVVTSFGSSADARAALVTIADMNSLEVEADVSEANITKVFVGQRCGITLDSFPAKRYRGEVSNIVPTVDRAKATVLAKIRFIDRDRNVIPEMSARVEFELAGER